MARDEAEFRAFVEARWPHLVRYAYALTGDMGHAEDAVQAALERSWPRWSQVRDENPEGYVRTAVARQVISWRRWTRRRPPEQFEGQAATGADSGLPDGSDSRALRAVLWAELRALPPRMRAVVVLRTWEDLSEEEVARLLGCSPGSVKSQLSRGLRRLREHPALREAVGLTTVEQSVSATPIDPATTGSTA